eukprot:91936_1
MDPKACSFHHSPHNMKPDATSVIIHRPHKIKPTACFGSMDSKSSNSNFDRTSLYDTMESKSYNPDIDPTTTCFLNHLPRDIELLVCRFLDSQSLCALASTCSEWQEVVVDDALWEFVYTTSWPPFHDLTTNITVSNTVFPEDWKGRYAERYFLEQNWVCGKPIVTTLSGHSGSITALDYDGERLVTASDDGSLILWKLHSSSRGDTEAAYSLMQQHHKQSRTTMKQTTFYGHGGPVWCVSISRDTLVSGSYDRTIKIWSVRQGSCRLTLRGHEGWVSCVSHISNSKRFLSASWDSSIKFWEVSDDSLSGHCSSTMYSGDGDAVYCVQWDEACGRVFSGSRREGVKVWDLETQQVVRSYSGHQKQVYCVQASADTIVSGSCDQTIKIWDSRSAECVATLKGHRGPVMSLQFDSYKVVSGSYDKTVKLFDIRMQKCVRSLLHHSSAIFALQYDAQKIITGSADKYALLWDFTCR